MTSSTKTKSDKKSTGRKRLLEIEYQLDELEHELISGSDPAREVVAMFAIRNALNVFLEDGVLKDADEQKARELILRIKIRTEFLRRMYPQNENR